MRDWKDVVRDAKKRLDRGSALVSDEEVLRMLQSMNPPDWQMPEEWRDAIVMRVALSASVKPPPKSSEPA